MVAVLGRKEHRQGYRARDGAAGVADVEHAVAGVGIGADAIARAIGRTKLNRHDDRPHALGGRAVKADCHGVVAIAQAKLLKSRKGVERSTRQAGLFAQLGGAKADGGINTDGERLVVILDDRLAAAARRAPRANAPDILTLQLAGEQRAKILAGEIVDAERLGKIVAGAHGQDGKSGAGVLLLRHKPVDDLVNHAVAAECDNGAIALSLCGQLLGVSHTLGQHQVKLGCACSHVQKALQTFGNFACRTRLGGWVGDDERATKISCVHGATPGV